MDTAVDEPLLDGGTRRAPASAVPIAVRFAGVTKRFGATTAVDRLDLEVPTGSITALLGPSGCGKTTALRLLAGFERPDAGEITVRDQLVSSRALHVPAERRRVGMVFQDYALFPHLTVSRNVAYGLRHLHRDDRRRRVAEVLELVGLTTQTDRLPAELSGGQRQRVALARALAPAPQVILLDEPFSNLDAALRASVRDDVQRILRAADATAVFVTHDQEEALSVADRVAVMRAGELLQVAAPHELYRSPADRFVATFVGDADVLPGRRASRYFVETALGRLATTAPFDETEVEVVIRPESVRLAPHPEGAGTVTAVTYFGHDQLVHVALVDGTEIRSREGPEVTWRPGQRVHVGVEGAATVFPVGVTPAPTAGSHTPDAASAPLGT